MRNGLGGVMAPVIKINSKRSLEMVKITGYLQGTITSKMVEVKVIIRTINTEISIEMVLIGIADTKMICTKMVALEIAPWTGLISHLKVVRRKLSSKVVIVMVVLILMTGAIEMKITGRGKGRLMILRIVVIMIPMG